MVKDTFEIGDEVMVRGAVTAVWPDGQVTVQLAGAGHKVTMPGDAGNIVVVDGEPAPTRPPAKRRRLI